MPSYSCPSKNVTSWSYLCVAISKSSRKISELQVVSQWHNIGCYNRCFVNDFILTPLRGENDPSCREPPACLACHSRALEAYPHQPRRGLRIASNREAGSARSRPPADRMVFRRRAGHVHVPAARGGGGDGLPRRTAWKDVDPISQPTVVLISKISRADKAGALDQNSQER
jgi:hypothetical protein